MSKARDDTDKIPHVCYATLDKYNESLTIHYILTSLRWLSCTKRSSIGTFNYLRIMKYLQHHSYFKPRSLHPGSCFLRIKNVTHQLCGSVRPRDGFFGTHIALGVAVPWITGKITIKLHFSHDGVKGKVCLQHSKAAKVTWLSFPPLIGWEDQVWCHIFLDALILYAFLLLLCEILIL